MTGRELNGPGGFLRVILRFLGLVAAPAIGAALLLWATTDRVESDLRQGELHAVGGAVRTLFEDDLARATGLLAGNALPWPEASPDDPAVRAAREGDTIRALRPRPDGLGVSVLLPAPDSAAAPVLRGDGRLRSTAVERLAELTGVSTGIYLDGRWVMGDSTAPAALLVEWMDAADTRGRDGAPVRLDTESRARLLPAMGGPAATTSVLVFRATTPRAPVGGVSRLLTLVLLLSATSVVVFGLGRGDGEEASPRLAAGGIVLLIVTMTGALGWSVSRTWVAERESAVRTLSRTAALVRAYDRVDDPIAAQRISGHRVLRILPDGGVATSDGSPVPAGAAALPTPPPSFPATGRLGSSGERYLVLRGEGGRTVLLVPERSNPLPSIVAGLGGAGVLLGLVIFLRGVRAARRGRAEGDASVSS